MVLLSACLCGVCVCGVCECERERRRERKRDKQGAGRCDRSFTLELLDVEPYGAWLLGPGWSFSSLPDAGYLSPSFLLLAFHPLHSPLLIHLRFFFLSVRVYNARAFYLLPIDSCVSLQCFSARLINKAVCLFTLTVDVSSSAPAIYQTSDMRLLYMWVPCGTCQQGY